MKIERLKLSHVWEIELSDAQLAARESFEAADRLAQSNGYAARVGGKLIALGGVVRATRDVGVAWSMISRHAGPHMLALTRAARRLFEVSGFARIVASTECDFAAGCRWLSVLGFKPIEKAEGFGDDGRDHQFYVRVR